MKFAFIAMHRSIWPVAWLCEALGVSRSGFDAWSHRSPSQHARYDEALLDKIKDGFKDSDRPYGARRVWHDLLAEGFSCGLTSRRASHAQQCNESKAAKARLGGRRRRAPGHHAECAGPAVRGSKAEPEVGGRFYHGRLRAGSM